jgi:hypothetical protein
MRVITERRDKSQRRAEGGELRVFMGGAECLVFEIASRAFGGEF